MMGDPASILNDRLRAAMRGALGDALPADADPLLAPSRNPQFGDYQSNAPMSLGKSVGRPPRDVAQTIVEHLKIDDIAEPPTVAGPGFINIRLRPDAIAAALEALDAPATGIDPPREADRETVVVDLCGVNLAKEMHVGHLRATVIGDALARLYERLGHHVLRQNHFGDWGLPIAMVTAAVKRLTDSGVLNLDALTEGELEKLYKRAQLACTADQRGLDAVRRFGLGPKAEAELSEQVAGAEEELAGGRRALVALQSGEPAFLAVWNRISQITLDACFENCRRLQVNVTAEHTAGESTYREELARVVADLESRGVAESSDGALVVRLDEFGIREPLIVRKSDGGFLYATTDLAGIRRRVQKLGAHRVLYAVDARQGLHFRQVFAASRKAGYARRTDGAEAQLFHAAFGTVLGEDNRPFKTRSGENVKLRDLINEAISRAEAAVATKNPDLSPDERRSVAQAVGIGAVKYTDLSSDRVRDYVFSFERMLAFEGNTGPYLQYALVRVYSIIRKALDRFGAEAAWAEPDADGAWMQAAAVPPPFRIDGPEEKAIALELLKYPGVIRAAAESCEPHRLCTYLYDLASVFSTFFAACPVLQAEDPATREARLRLCRLTGRILRDGLHTLGITPLMRM